MSIRFKLVLILVLVAGVFVGQHTAMSPAPVPNAYAAACQGAHGACPFLDPSRTAALSVTHQNTAATAFVEPDTGESWSIKAYWNSNAAPCNEYTETATVDVDWVESGGTGWWALSNLSTTTNIVGVTICTTATCSNTDGGYGYKLIVDVIDPVVVTFVNHNLRQVVFTTTSVDDGNEIGSAPTCADSTSVSPTTQTFTATDVPAFGCAYNCNEGGASLTITYN